MRVLALAALLLAGCASSPEPAGRAAALPAGTHLPRTAIGAQEGRAVLIEDAQPCYAVSLYDTASPPERLATSPIDRPGCRPWTAAVSADGSTTAVFAFDRGEVHLIRRSGDRLEPDGLLTLPDPAAFPHPPPGRNVALSPDGATLLVGAIDRDCVTLEGRIRCGTAYLYRRGPQGWTLASRLQRPPDAALGAQHGQTLAVLPDGAALVGGTGIIADAGALHLFLPDGRYAQSLLPPGGDQFYATEIATSGDGTWLAVGADQSVVVYRRTGDRFEPAQTLTAPEDNAGHFGEAVAIDATGRELIVGAPRAACPAGQRCGIVYRYRRDGDAWQLAGTIRAAREEAHAGFGHKLALSGSGAVLAVEGRGVELIRAAR